MADTDIEAEAESAASRSFELPYGTPPERLDKVLARLIPEHSRSRIQGWIEDGHVLLNGKPARIRQPVQGGDSITVFEQEPPEALAFVGEPVEFSVIAESDDWIVINKPAGLVTHPGAGNWSGTLLNGLLYRYPELRQVARAGIVHRLDKDTSGLLVVARNEVAQTHLVRQLQARTMGREYLALVQGELWEGGTIDRPIGRDPRVPVRMAVEHPVAAKPALTHYQPLRRGVTPPNAAVTEVACRLETGRTHQIRVHLASLRHPLVGDLLYGGKQLADVSRQMLHARTLAFDDAASGERLTFHAELPPDFVAALENIEWNA